MSFVSIVPEMLSAAADNLQSVGSDVAAENTAALAPTTGLIPAACRPGISFDSNAIRCACTDVSGGQRAGRGDSPDVRDDVGDQRQLVCQPPRPPTRSQRAKER